jgi:YadA-like membrane anchor domain
MRVLVLAIAIGVMLGGTSAAEAQSNPFIYSNVSSKFFAGQPADLQNDYVTTERISGGSIAFGGALNLGQFVPSMIAANVPSMIAANQALTEIDGILAYNRRQTGRLFEGVSMASAMTILPPNPGDRFSFTFAGANFYGNNAFSGTFSYRLNDQILLFAGYARSSTGNLAKGGVSISIH